MDLMSDLNPNIWENSNMDHISGLRTYLVIRCKSTGRDTVEAFLQEDEESAPIKKALLQGVASGQNPLRSVRKLLVKLDERDEATISAMCLEDDCVVRKNGV